MPVKEEMQEKMSTPANMFIAGILAFSVNILVIVEAANKIENRLTVLETRQDMIIDEIKKAGT